MICAISDASNVAKKLDTLKTIFMKEPSIKSESINSGVWIVYATISMCNYSEAKVLASAQTGFREILGFKQIREAKEMYLT